MVLWYSPIYMQFILKNYLLLLSPFVYKVKVPCISFYLNILYTPMTECDSSPGVVWCINKV